MNYATRYHMLDKSLIKNCFQFQILLPVYTSAFNIPFLTFSFICFGLENVCIGYCIEYTAQKSEKIVTSISASYVSLMFRFWQSESLTWHRTLQVDGSHRGVRYRSSVDNFPHYINGLIVHHSSKRMATYRRQRLDETSSTPPHAPSQGSSGVASANRFDGNRVPQRDLASVKYHLLAPVCAIPVLLVGLVLASVRAPRILTATLRFINQLMNLNFNLSRMHDFSRVK